MTRLLRWMKLWPPFLGAGIRVKECNADITRIVTQTRLRFWNTNYVGTQFGGTLYAMTDPFYMLMLLHHLGRDYIVWDKAANIQFKKPGRGTVTATFELTQERLAELRAAADSSWKVEPTFTVYVKDDAGEVIAQVDKLLYIRRKDREKGRT